jgi:hypothetical protein
LDRSHEPGRGPGGRETRRDSGKPRGAGHLPGRRGLNIHRRERRGRGDKGSRNQKAKAKGKNQKWVRVTLLFFLPFDFCPLLFDFLLNVLCALCGKIEEIGKAGNR